MAETVLKLANRGNQALQNNNNFNTFCFCLMGGIILPVNMIELFGLLPHISMKWTASPNRRLGCPQNTTQGCRENYKELHAKGNIS